MTRPAIAALAIAASSLGAGCPGPRTPQVAAAAPQTVDLARPGASLRGVAGDGAHMFVALRVDPPASRDEGAPPTPVRTVVEARREEGVAWTAELTGGAGPIAASDGVVAVALAGMEDVGAVSGGAAVPPVRGEPGAAVVALDARTGQVRWRIGLDASDWVVTSAVAPAPGGVLVGGAFSGSLRLRDRVVASGGRSDGFIARIGAGGDVAWLVRIGGPGPDAVQGVAATGERIAIAGTFAAGADLLGQPLPAFDEKSPFPDGFVAMLDGAGARVWSATFGGKHPDAVAGVAIDRTGRVAVAATARDVVHVGGVDVVAQGPADGLIAWWSPAGAASHAVKIGGADFDGLRAITAVGDRVVVGGFYSGTLRLGDHELVAGGGDGAFLAAYDDRGVLVDRWDIAGPGREEVAALQAVPGGFVAGIAHTAGVTLAGVELPSPADPMTGAAVIVRPVP